jgi:hypothetical protein
LGDWVKTGILFGDEIIYMGKNGAILSGVVEQAAHNWSF